MGTVGFFDEKSRIILRDWEVLSISVKDEDKAMSHAVEDGGQITDWRVRQPTEVTVQMAVSGEATQSAWRELSLLRESGKLVTILTRNWMYKNMLLLGQPYDNKSDTWDLLMMTVVFREVRFVTPKHTSVTAMPHKNVKHGKSADTLDRGKVETKPASEKSKSVIRDLLG